MSVNPVASPFDPSKQALYHTWSEKKLEHYPVAIEDLLVEISNPKQISPAEHEAMLAICRKTNMVLYAGNTANQADKDIPLAVGKRFGLTQLNSNWLADDEGVTSLTVVEEGTRQAYIPYSNRAIQWHTDGYYHSREQQIHGLLLHCVQNAATGGENALLDHEIAYIFLRNKNPAYIQALMQNDVMTIPARMNEGKVERAAQTGPVFSINPTTGHLHMRYSVRNQHIIWKQDPLTLEALSYLSDILENCPHIFRATLQPGMGLVSNNVLHDRANFEDDKAKPRLLYRARYFDRIVGS